MKLARELARVIGALSTMGSELGEPEWTEQLIGEMLVCGFLARALYAAPDRFWLDGLIAQCIFAELPYKTAQPEAPASLSVLQSWCASGPLTDAAWEALQDDYTRLFIGPGKLLAPPWQSVYLDGDRLVFQVHTVQVNSYYERFGLELGSEYREPADHVGLQFEFLAHLAEISLQALRDRDNVKFSELCTAQRGFLRNHMIRWVPHWSRDVDTYARTDFYRGVALLASGILRDLDLVFGIAAPKDRHKGPRLTHRNSWAAS